MTDETNTQDPDEDASESRWASADLTDDDSGVAEDAGEPKESEEPEGEKK